MRQAQDLPASIFPTKSTSTQALAELGKDEALLLMLLVFQTTG